jgi:hypothetical protein
MVYHSDLYLEAMCMIYMYQNYWVGRSYKIKKLNQLGNSTIGEEVKIPCKPTWFGGSSYTRGSRVKSPLQLTWLTLDLYLECSKCQVVAITEDRCIWRELIRQKKSFSILTGKETRRCGSWGLGNNDEINLVLAAFKPVLRVCCAWLPSNSDCPGR